jgi:hypothetical protein
MCPSYFDKFTSSLVKFLHLWCLKFDLFIGQPIERLIWQGHTGKIRTKLGKKFKFFVPFTHSLNAYLEPLPEPDPIKDVKVACLDEFVETYLEDDA